MHNNQWNLTIPAWLGHARLARLVRWLISANVTSLGLIIYDLQNWLLFSKVAAFQRLGLARFHCICMHYYCASRSIDKCYNSPFFPGKKYNTSGIPPGTSAVAVFRMRWWFHSVMRSVSCFCISGPKQYLIASLIKKNWVVKSIMIMMYVCVTHMLCCTLLSKCPFSCNIILYTHDCYINVP